MTKNIFLILVKVFLFIACINIPIWIFNHINPWLGWISIIPTILFIYLIFKNKKTKQNEKTN